MCPRHLSQDKMFLHINDVHYKAGGRAASLEAEKKELELEVERLRYFLDFLPPTSFDLPGPGLSFRPSSPFA